jgi:hypothetical protein
LLPCGHAFCEDCLSRMLRCAPHALRVGNCHPTFQGRQKFNRLDALPRLPVVDPM